MKRLFPALILLTACTSTNQPHAPVSDSMIAGPYVATLIETMEFRIPELAARPENDRYKLSLVLHPLDGGAPRTVPIKSGLRASDFIHAARIISDDGQRLFFHAHEPMAYNYSTGNLSYASSPNPRPLSARNPTPHDLRDPAACPDCKRPALLKTDHTLLLHRSSRGIFGTELLSRLSPDGKRLWTADTDLQDVTELLPTPNHTAFIGQKSPEKPDAFRPPFLVIVNNNDGAITTHPL
jgi:hypothetical protein